MAAKIQDATPARCIKVLSDGSVVGMQMSPEPMRIIEDAFEDSAGRFPHHVRILLQEVTPGVRMGAVERRTERADSRSERGPIIAGAKENAGIARGFYPDRPGFDHEIRPFHHDGECFRIEAPLLGFFENRLKPVVNVAGPKLAQFGETQVHVPWLQIMKIESGGDVTARVLEGAARESFQNIDEPDDLGTIQLV